ncbi:MAG: arylsulfatase [Chitinophagaceae bacterium]|nr:arylsulfatase [Chitinophagaceae bacterium]
MVIRSLNRRKGLSIALYCFTACCFLSFHALYAQKKNPNIVLIFMDDMGYADLSCYGSKTISTPNIDKLAASGMKFTDFHVTASVCTPSRTALLTGCYPHRIGLPKVLFPEGSGSSGNKGNTGLNPEEETLAELLKAKGYATSMAGKWHLGDKKMFLPTQQGFDNYLGVPYSNDMTIAPDMVLSESVLLRKGMTSEMIKNYASLKMEKKNHQTPLLKNNEVIEFPADQTTLTKRYTEFGIDFINQQAGKSPFFLYLAHTMPHIPIFASEKFEGISKGGLYGDVIEEVDWSVGEIIKALERKGVLDNTLVIFTSDNGPWLSYGNHGGSAGVLRGGKFDIFEGGFRVPCIMSLPGVIPKGKVSDKFITSLDIVPTICQLTGAALPAKKIDGIDVLPVLKGKEVKILNSRYFYYFTNNKLSAIRKGNWKYIIPITYQVVTTAGKDGKDGKTESRQQEEALYNLKKDISESLNKINEYPEIANELKNKLEIFDQNLKKETRPVGISLK